MAPSVLHVRLPASLRAQIRDLAAREQVSLNVMVTLLLAEGIGYKVGRDELPQRTFTRPR